MTMDAGEKDWVRLCRVLAMLPVNDAFVLYGVTPGGTIGVQPSAKTTLEQNTAIPLNKLASLIVLIFRPHFLQLVLCPNSQPNPSRCLLRSKFNVCDTT